MINNLNRHFTGKKDAPDQYSSSNLYENELDLKPIVSKKKKKSYKKFSLALCESKN